MTIVTPSKWLKALVEQSFLKEYPVNVIYNGIDLDVFHPTKIHFDKLPELNNKYLILGIVASEWSERKGLQDFLKLANILDKNKYQIILVGLSKQQIKKLPNYVIGIERTGNVRELAGIYTQADVFFNPTYEDNFPTTNLESIACGTPVITYNTGGSPEAISKNTGVVIEKGKIENVAQWILEHSHSKIDHIGNLIN